MSFRCDKCSKALPAGSSPNRVTLELRRVTYPARPEANDKGGSGIEIAKEANYCDECKEALVP